MPPEELAMFRVFVFGVMVMLVVAFAEVANAMDNAHDLVSKCQQVGKSLKPTRRQVFIPNTPAALQCWGYIQAIQNFLVLVDENGDSLLGACAPEKTTLLQLLNSFLAYTKRHPAELDGNAAVVMIKAMQEAYPCHSEAAQN
jgi:Rap1a immunity proteins